MEVFPLFGLFLNTTRGMLQFEELQVRSDITHVTSAKNVDLTPVCLFVRTRYGSSDCKYSDQISAGKKKKNTERQCCNLLECFGVFTETIPEGVFVSFFSRPRPPETFMTFKWTDTSL